MLACLERGVHLIQMHFVCGWKIMLWLKSLSCALILIIFLISTCFYSPSEIDDMVSFWDPSSNYILKVMPKLYFTRFIYCMYDYGFKKILYAWPCHMFSTYFWDFEIILSFHLCSNILKVNIWIKGLHILHKFKSIYVQRCWWQILWDDGFPEQGLCMQEVTLKITFLKSDCQMILARTRSLML